MSVNQIKIRRKEVKTSPSKLSLFACLTIMILLGIIVAVAFASFSGSGFSDTPLEIVSDGKRQIIRVPAGGNLQAAIGKARGGDVIELQAGAVYRGEIVLPNKPITDFITIQSSRAGELPENKRVSPKQAELMAKIHAPGQSKPAVSTENGAHHYRFVGIEFAPAGDDYVYNLVFFGEPKNTNETAHHLEIDRSYIRSRETGVTRRGLALNSADTVIKNSYFAGFAYPGEETQGICGWTGTKNVKVLNNYVEGGAENIMFGGSDPASADLNPSDIEVRGNHLKKPVEWKNKNTVKCLFELKNALRVVFAENLLEDNWVGSAFRITVRNDGGLAPFSTIEDVTIKDNIVKGAGEGINILGTDYIHPSETLRNLTVTNNLFLDIGGKQYEGAGYFVQINGGENILFANNTIFNNGNLATLYDNPAKNFLFRDNIVGHGEYGIHGHDDIKSVAGQRLFANNVIVNNRKVAENEKYFPPNNFWVQDIGLVGFVNYAQNDFRLSEKSRFKGKGKNGTDIGSSLTMR